jgi:hypothetical protein
VLAFSSRCRNDDRAFWLVEPRRKMGDFHEHWRPRIVAIRARRIESAGPLNMAAASLARWP